MSNIPVASTCRSIYFEGGNARAEVVLTTVGGQQLACKSVPLQVTPEEDTILAIIRDRVSSENIESLTTMASTPAPGRILP